MYNVFIVYKSLYHLTDYSESFIYTYHTTNYDGSLKTRTLIKPWLKGMNNVQKTPLIIYDKLILMGFTKTHYGKDFIAKE